MTGKQKDEIKLSDLVVVSEQDNCSSATTLVSPTSSQYSLPGARQLFQSLPRNIEDWNHFTFFTLFFIDGDRIMSFTEYYLKYIHRRLPYIPKDWIENHFGDIPMCLLHAMYAYALVVPARDWTSTNISRTHANYTWRYCVDHLEELSSLTLCALGHLLGYYAECKQVNWLLAVFSMAAAAAKTLRLYHGEKAVLRVPTGHEFDVTHLNKVSGLPLMSRFCGCRCILVI
ncbi:hypothetical protein HDU91_001151 [Kappamyces sp. JEL0680]|nr:hypothetical protein HDU91_001151 [Kappamyces sp. JEL0680]